MVLLTACAGGDGRTESFPPPAAVQEAESPERDDAFFEFAAARLGGGSQVTGAELQGKDVALWFWAPW